MSSSRWWRPSAIPGSPLNTHFTPVPPGGSGSGAADPGLGSLRAPTTRGGRMLEGLYYEISVAAARQQGFVTRAQATRLGADDAALDRLKEFKLLVEIDDGVFQ